MKRIISLFLALILICGLIPSALASQSPAQSNNLDYHWYVNAERWATPIYSNLAYENGNYVRAECIGSDLVVETYDQSFQFLSGKAIPLELPIFGGVRMDKDYNFLVVGQLNYEEDDSREVIRIIRYTKDWKKVDHASLYGANTTVPFDAGSLRFDRSGDILYIRTAHEMYTTEDGVNHQANVMISLRIRDMTVTDQLTKILNPKYGYVSHSFNQFVRVDGDTLLAVDHGDYYPRSVALFKYGAKAGSETFYSRTTMVNALPIVNSTYHYNDTGVSVGGFEFSDTHYLIAGNSYHQQTSADLMEVHRNIFVTATPKNNFTDEGTVIHWLTDYAESDKVSVSPPHMMKVSANRFLLTWTENDVLKYCFVNGSGQLDGSIKTHSGHMSDCAPIRVGNQAVWYVTDYSAPKFYQIEVESCKHSYTASVTKPTCTRQGYTTHTCTNCGNSYTDSYTAALGHEYLDYKCIRCGVLQQTPFTDVTYGDYYHIPVLWAVEKGITTGASATKFEPFGIANRAQAVTFLWRAAGKPKPTKTENPFTDVEKGQYYYDAVLWAVENGITHGTSATTFSPYEQCSRCQVVTFLWRAEKSPTVQAQNPFTDVNIGDYFYGAVLWAAKNGITNGISPTEFGVYDLCNRSQIVTFLYRSFAE